METIASTMSMGTTATSKAHQQHSPVLVRMMRSLQSQRKKVSQKSKSQTSLMEEAVDSSLGSEDLFVSKPSFTSTKVFGRHEELQQLLAIYEHIAMRRTSHSRVAMVHGASGVGKSTLIRAFVRRLPKQALFVSGKFDQLQTTHAPYAALISASNDLARLALTTKTRHGKLLLSRLKSELGPDINLLGNILQALSSMADKKASIATSGKAFTRFKLLIRGFFRAMATPDSPVVLFLDDLQWADTATIQVLNSFLTDPLSQHIMFLFSYRDEEMNNKDFLKDFSISSKQADDTTPEDPVKRTDIVVSNLDLTSLNKMVATILNVPTSRSLSLSNIIYNKTDGNPFYTLNFMDMLYTCGMLVSSQPNNDNNDGTVGGGRGRGDNGSNQWKWNETTILEQTNVADNLASILEAKILRLPEKVRSILQLASFIGYDFSANVLVTIVHEEQDMIEGEYSFETFDKKIIQQWIVDALNLALNEGLLENTTDEETYKFSHDRIQHCLYNELIPDDVERRLLHQRIGKLIWNTIRSEDEDQVKDWVLFLAADNLNRGPKFIDDDEDRVEMIELNIRAARLAAEKAAFLVAVEYLRHGDKLITGNDFIKANHDICMDLFRTLAEMARKIGCFDESDVMVKRIHEFARDLDDRFHAHLTEINTLAIQGNLRGALQLGIKTWGQVGMHFPKKVTKWSIIKEFVLTKIVIGKRTAEDLIHLPTLTDKKIIQQLEVAGTVAGYAFISGEAEKDIFVVASLRIARITFRHGLSQPNAPLAFLGYGMVCSFLGKYDLGCSFEDAAMTLLQQQQQSCPDTHVLAGRIIISSLSLIHPWKHGVNEELIEGFMQGYHKAMLVGDVDYAYFGATGWILSGFVGGLPLSELIKKANMFIVEMQEYGTKSHLLTNLPILQMLHNMVDTDSIYDPAILSGDIIKLGEFTEAVLESKSTLVLYALKANELLVAYYFNDWPRVERILKELVKLAPAAKGYWNVPANQSFIAWCSYRMYERTGHVQHKRNGRRFARLVKGYDSKGSPLGSMFTKLLKAGHLLYFKKRSPLECEKHFISAFVVLRNCKNMKWMTHVCEALGESFFQVREYEKAKIYMQYSLDATIEWGAAAKVPYLKERVALFERHVGNNDTTESMA